jgi:hypothetical protein
MKQSAKLFHFQDTAEYGRFTSEIAAIGAERSKLNSRVCEIAQRGALKVSGKVSTSDYEEEQLRTERVAIDARADDLTKKERGIRSEMAEARKRHDRATELNVLGLPAIQRFEDTPEGAALLADEASASEAISRATAKRTSLIDLNCRLIAGPDGELEHVRAEVKRHKQEIVELDGEIQSLQESWKRVVAARRERAERLKPELMAARLEPIQELMDALQASLRANARVAAVERLMRELGIDFGPSFVFPELSDADSGRETVFSRLKTACLNAGMKMPERGFSIPEAMRATTQMWDAAMSGVQAERHRLLPHVNRLITAVQDYARRRG